MIHSVTFKRQLGLLDMESKVLKFSNYPVHSLLLLLFLLLLVFGGAVPVVKDLQRDDPVTAGGDDVGEGHQGVSSLLQNTM